MAELSLDSVDSVIAEPVKFKLKLDIGEDAYKSLKLKRYLLDSVDAANGAIAGVAVANSSVVASTFFSKGLLGFLGFSAATPVGWAIAAGVAGAGLSLVIGRKLVRGKSSQVKVIPDYINTPMDILAVGLFDLIGMLSVKVAQIDGDFAEVEREKIQHYFVKEWGYETDFVRLGLIELEAHANEHSIQMIATKLAEYKKDNPDCNYHSLSQELMNFLQELVEVDGQLHESEELALEKVREVFKEVAEFSLVKTAGDVVHKVSDSASTGVQKVKDSAAGLVDILKPGKHSKDD